MEDRIDGDFGGPSHDEIRACIAAATAAAKTNGTEQYVSSNEYIKGKDNDPYSMAATAVQQILKMKRS